MAWRIGKDVDESVRQAAKKFERAGGR